MKQLSIFTLSMVFAGLAGAAEIGVKSLAGPPAEFSQRALPSAEDTVISTNILALGSKQALPGKAAASSTSSFSTSTGTGFSVVQVTSHYPSFGPITLNAPGGARFTFNGSTLSCDFGPCGSYEASLKMEAFTNSAGGAVSVSISGGEVTGGSWQLTEQTPTPLLTAVEIDSVVAFDDNVVDVGIDPDPCLRPTLQICPPEHQPFAFTAGAAPTFSISASRANEKSGKRSLDLTDLTVTVTESASGRVTYRHSLGMNELTALPRDDVGQNLVSLPALEAGGYSVRLDIEGIVQGLGPIERTAFYYLPILPQSHKLTGAIEARESVDSRRLELLLGIEELDTGELAAPNHLYAYAEVWARSVGRPIAWVGGMTQPQPGEDGGRVLPLELDARWLALAGDVGSELELRNVRIQDPDTFIPLHQVASMPFSLERLPKAALMPKSRIAMEESMFTGRGDRTITVPDLPQNHGFKNNLDTGIFLVHGWCSNPAWPTADFINPGRIGGTAVFNDAGESRSHDNFARRIRDQGDACFNDSFSVVAHSQGGAAAVHLRTFYNSGLDASTAPRRIQSMGTPYGGSTLMDFYLATGPLGWLLSEIFGFCGPQFNLGTLGAALWRTGIPNWARDDVFYYRTRHRRPGNFWERLQFWRWRCNIASFVIPGTDDGVVSTSQGSFSNANNMGVTDRECHTGGMNHVDQKDNEARNDIMDAEGRPAPPPPLQARCQVRAIWHPGGPTGNGYWEYSVDASGSTGPVNQYRWRNGGGSWGPWGSQTIYGPLFPGLPGQASNYTIWVQVRDTAGNTSGTSCAVP